MSTFSFAFFLQKFTSRKFLLAIAGIVLAVIADPAGLDITNQAQTALTGVPIAYIISEAIIDIVRELKKSA